MAGVGQCSYLALDIMLSAVTKDALTRARYPRSNAYDPTWVFANEMGPNALWLMEWLCDAIELRSGMRVLDMGCGRAMSSIFLAREFDVQVWANDLWISATDNWERICAAGVQDQVFPIHAEAHQLPYADNFFDVILSVDSYHYYGTDDLYLAAITRLLKPGGRFGIVVPGLVRDFENDIVPEHLAGFWDPRECFSFHTVDWWRRHLSASRILELQVADLQEDGARDWAGFIAAQVAAGATTREWTAAEGAQVAADDGQYLGFIRVAGKLGETA